MLPGYSANKDVFLPASCSFMLPGNSLAWQGLQTQQKHFWSHAGHAGPPEVTAHRQGLAAKWILEHQLCTERTFLSVCCIHHFFTNYSTSPSKRVAFKKHHHLKGRHLVGNEGECSALGWSRETPPLRVS